MVLNIAIDEGYGIRRGKAYGKFMGSEVESEEDVVMTTEEGSELGCLVGLKTVDEQRAMVERAREMKRLEAALRQVRALFAKIFFLFLFLLLRLHLLVAELRQTDNTSVCALCNRSIGKSITLASRIFCIKSSEEKLR